MTRLGDAATAYLDAVDDAGAAGRNDVSLAFFAGADHGANHLVSAENPLASLVIPVHRWSTDRKHQASADWTVDLTLAFAAGALWSVAEREAAATAAAADPVRVTVRRDRTFVAVGRKYMVRPSLGHRAVGYDILDLTTLHFQGGYRTVDEVRSHVAECVARAWPIVGELPE